MALSFPLNPSVNQTVTQNGRVYRWTGLAWEFAPSAQPDDSRWTLFTPGAPTNLAGTAANAQVSLTWTAPSTTYIPPITDYVVQYSSDSGSTWTTFSDGASSNTGATVTGLTNGTAYIFKVAAVNGVGVGTYSSNSASVTPLTTPGAPTAVSGTAGDTEVSLTWSAPASNGGAAITDYVVQYSSDSGSNWTTFSDGTSTNTSAVVTGLTNDTTYVFRIAAVNSVGTGTYSSASSGVTPAAPNALAGDPYYDNVTLLLRMNGTSGSTTFSDDSQYNATAIPTGTNSAVAAINTNPTVAKYGSGVGHFRGTWNTSYGGWDEAGGIRFPYSSGRYEFGASEDFCIELWVRFNGWTAGWGQPGKNGILSTSWYLACGMSPCAGWGLYYSDPESRLVFYYKNTTDANVAEKLSGSGALSLGTWYHIAVSRVAGTLRLFKDGVVIATATNDTTAYVNYSGDTTGWPGVRSLNIASLDPNTENSGYSFNESFFSSCYMDDVRITRGQGRYAANFTPPTAEFYTNSPTATPPAAPTNLAGTAFDETVALTWTRPTVVNGGAITDYLIQYKLSTDSSWTTFSHAASTQTSIAVTGLTNDSAYDFRVSAVNAAGAGSPTATATATPSAPSLSGYNSDNKFRFYLANAETAGFAYAETTTGYWRLQASNGALSAVTSTPYYYSSTPAYITGLPTGRIKEITVFSCDSAGNPSGQLTYVNLTGLSRPFAPYTTVAQQILKIDASGCTSLDGFSAGGTAANMTNNSMYSSNSLPATITEVRAVGVQGRYGSYSPPYNNNYPAGYYGGINIAGQDLSAAALDQFYTDLGNARSTGAPIMVSNNPGTNSDTPSIATAKGYTVYPV